MPLLMPYIQNAAEPKGLGGYLFVRRMNRHHEQGARWAFSHLPLEDGSDCLDVGCGGGMNVRRMLEACPWGRVCGADISAVSVSQSRRANRRAVREGRCEIVRAGAGALPFPDGSFDFVTAEETVYYWSDPVGCFREMRRVLRDGGMFMIANETDDPGVGWAGSIEGLTVYTLDDLEGMILEAGFSEVETHRGDDGWVAAIGVRRSPVHQVDGPDGLPGNEAH